MSFNINLYHPSQSTQQTEFLSWDDVNELDTLPLARITNEQLARLLLDVHYSRQVPGEGTIHKLICAARINQLLPDLIARLNTIAQANLAVEEQNRPGDSIAENISKPVSSDVLMNTELRSVIEEILANVKSLDSSNPKGLIHNLHALVGLWIENGINAFSNHFKYKILFTLCECGFYTNGYRVISQILTSDLGLNLLDKGVKGYEEPVSLFLRTGGNIVKLFRQMEPSLFERKQIAQYATKHDDDLKNDISSNFYLALFNRKAGQNILCCQSKDLFKETKLVAFFQILQDQCIVQRKPSKDLIKYLTYALGNMDQLQSRRLSAMFSEEQISILKIRYPTVFNLLSYERPEKPTTTWGLQPAEPTESSFLMFRYAEKH